MKLDGQGPLYEQVGRALRQAIHDGTLTPGSRLPSSRSLARRLRVSRTVAVTAFDQLMAEGYVESRVGSGTYVTASLGEALFDPTAELDSAARNEPAGETVARLSHWGARALEQSAYGSPSFGNSVEIDFRYGFAPPDPDLYGWWRRAIGRSSMDPRLDYGPAEGDLRLRRELATHLRLRRGVVCSPEQILIVSGSQQALDLITRVLIDPGSGVVIEDPNYQGARSVLAAAGARLIPIAVDANGMEVESLLGSDHASDDVRLAYVTPSHQFPSGAVMPLDRRIALLGWAAARNAYVVEDDYDSEYRYQGKPIPAVQSLDHESRTIYVGSLSKVLFPAVRIGYVVVPDALVEVLRTAKWLADRHSSTLEQRALAEFLATGTFDRHLRRMRRRHAQRREVLIRSLGAELGDRVEVMGTKAGIHVVVWLRGIRADRVPELIRGCAAAGVGIYDIGPYYLRAPKAAGLLFGYGGLEPEEIRRGVEMFARVAIGLWSNRESAGV